MIPARLAREARWALRHPIGAALRIVRRLARDPGIPVGRTAQTRRLLQGCLGSPERVLVVGPPAAVRQAVPGALLDVVGTDPRDRTVTVVSQALRPGSLPQRWEAVVVTEPAPSPGRLAAVAQACLPGGVVAVVDWPFRSGLLRVPGSRVEVSARTRRLHLLVARMPA